MACLAQAAQVVPLEVSEIVPAISLWLLGLKQVEHPTHLPILPCQMRLTHLGQIEIAESLPLTLSSSPLVAAGPLALLVRAPRLGHRLLGVVLCLLGSQP